MRNYWKKIVTKKQCQWVAIDNPPSAQGGCFLLTSTALSEVGHSHNHNTTKILKWHKQWFAKQCPQHFFECKQLRSLHSRQCDQAWARHLTTLRRTPTKRSLPPTHQHPLQYDLWNAPYCILVRRDTCVMPWTVTITHPQNITMVNFPATKVPKVHVWVPGIFASCNNKVAMHPSLPHGELKPATCKKLNILNRMVLRVTPVWNRGLNASQLDLTWFDQDIVSVDMISGQAPFFLCLGFGGIMFSIKVWVAEHTLEAKWFQNTRWFWIFEHSAAHADQNSCIQDKLPNMFGVLCCESGGANVCGLTLRHHSVSQHHLTFNKSAVEWWFYRFIHIHVSIYSACHWWEDGFLSLLCKRNTFAENGQTYFGTVNVKWFKAFKMSIE